MHGAAGQNERRDRREAGGRRAQGLGLLLHLGAQCIGFLFRAEHFAQPREPRIDSGETVHIDVYGLDAPLFGEVGHLRVHAGKEYHGGV